ncbi:Ig-like domain-containing protein [Cohnella sp. GCM10027633]|uniref:Ig-like domain-containing protein n=1 Tax=unclassified Cohnella TaxID=2636738 RepID=UPI00362BC35E
MIDIGYWIKDTHPYPDAVDVPDDTIIAIAFTQDVNRHTLNARNILILDGNQGGKLISEKFLYHYEQEKHTLFVYLKEEADRLGSGNRIEIILTGRITNYRNEQMEVPFHLRFTTR